MEKVPNRTYATDEEVEEALSNLSDEDFLRLELLAESLVSYSEIVSPEKLWKETVESALTLSRKWPTDVKFVIFFFNAMRSIADGYRKKQTRMFRLFDNDDLNPDSGSPEEQLLESEHEKFVQARYQEIWELFSDDDMAEAILLGREDNMSPKEIQENFEISETQYASTLRRMRRKISKKYPQGWQIC